MDKWWWRVHFSSLVVRLLGGERERENLVDAGLMASKLAIENVMWFVIRFTSTALLQTKGFSQSAQHVSQTLRIIFIQLASSPQTGKIR